MTASVAMPDVHRSPPPSRQIADYYREKIRAGGIEVGESLPGVKALVAEWSVSEHTASRAMHILRDEGIVQVQRGKPTVVVGVPAPAEEAPPP